MYILSESQKKLLTKIFNWLYQYEDDKTVFFITRFKEIGYLKSVVSKVLVLEQYTDGERDVLNELRYRFSNDLIEGELPF